MAPKDKLLRESIKIGERSSRKSKGLPDRTQNTDCVSYMTLPRPNDSFSRNRKKYCGTHPSKY